MRECMRKWQDSALYQDLKPDGEGKKSLNVRVEDKVRITFVYRWKTEVVLVFELNNRGLKKLSSFVLPS